MTVPTATSPFDDRSNVAMVAQGGKRYNAAHSKLEVPMECPNCRSLNPDSALQCDCGYNFEKNLMERTLTEPVTINTPSRKRPIWVWVISIFYIISAFYSCLAFYLCLTGAIPLNAAQKACFENLTVVDWGLTTVTGLVTLGSAVCLFLLRRQALYLFAGSLALHLLSNIYGLHKAATALSATPGASVGMFLGWGILLAVCLYTWRLAKAGTLRWHQPALPTATRIFDLEAPMTSQTPDLQTILDWAPGRGTGTESAGTVQ
jgi:hypothetical protein